MDNQNLNAFIAVAESKSFSEAANLLDVTQSTISKRIALLESKIGQNYLIESLGKSPSLKPASSCYQGRNIY